MSADEVSMAILGMSLGDAEALAKTHGYKLLQDTGASFYATSRSIVVKVKRGMVASVRIHADDDEG